MEVVPQRMYANPAFFPSYSKINIGLPIISSDYFNVSNSGFKYSDLIKHRSQDDSLVVDYNNMLSKLKKNNYLTLATQIDLLSFGFAVKKNYFSFNMTEKVDLRFSYPKSFMEFIDKGNGGLLGQQVNFNLGINATHYREYGFGYSRKINDKLTIGGKFKYLYGMENVSTEKSDVSLTTNPNDFAITAKANIKINTSGLDTGSFNNFNVSNYAFKKKNNGMGIDLGAVYKYNDKFTFSASVIDLGFIKWQQSVTTYQSANPNANFNFQGLDVNQLIKTDSTNNLSKTVTDSLKKTFKIDTVHKTYTTRLTSKIYLSAKYNLTEKINVGILFYGEIFDQTLHPGVALSYNQRVGRWLGFSLSYSMYNRSYNNIGLGLSHNLGPVQIYIVSDNVLGAIFPQNTKNINLRTGINLTFGRIKNDKDKDGIPDKKDDCPEVPGIAEFKGCPDKDKDHVQDKDDLCPNDSGSVELKGCPDRDGDKIIDITDSCPDVAGLPEFHGCPDKDGDGVMDKIDLCPDKPGPASNNGCPETKLNLIDTLGTTIKTVVIGKDSSFTFDNLPADELVRFKLEGEKTDSINEVKVIVGGTVKKAVRDSVHHYFHFIIAKQIIPVEAPKEVAVKLDQQEAEVLKKAFNNLEFASAKGIIKDESLPSLDELAVLMAKKPSWRLKISGHTDNQGKPATNLKLSEKRAEAIKQYLVSKGIAPERFKVEWFGSTKPIADNKTAEGRQKNRRVEMLIIE